MIAIVDYGMGNIRSVEKAFIKIGADVRITADPKVIADAKGIVLPGVGAFKDCMRNLDDLRLLDCIVKEIGKGKPYLGICLGLQILFTESEEFGFCRGLNVFRGKVVKFKFNEQGSTLKIPHMGWNHVAFQKDHPVFRDIPDEAQFYFVHSYYPSPADDRLVIGWTDYGQLFCAALARRNLVAVQFHPEKSGRPGLQILANFCRWEGEDA